MGIAEILGRLRVLPHDARVVRDLGLGKDNAKPHGYLQREGRPAGAGLGMNAGVCPPHASAV
jgi:hypothetical protein